MDFPILSHRAITNDLREMNRLMARMIGDSDVDRAFDRLFTRNGALATTDWAPSVDVEETEGNYVIKADIPQVKKEDVKISVEDGVLALSGARHQEKEEKGKRFHRVERSYGSFYRSFRLPDNIDETKIDAKFADGVLTITLPKDAKPKQNVHEVKVN